MKRLSS